MHPHYLTSPTNKPSHHLIVPLSPASVSSPHPPAPLLPFLSVVPRARVLQRNLNFSSTPSASHRVPSKSMPSSWKYCTTSEEQTQLEPYKTRADKLPRKSLVRETDPSLPSVIFLHHPMLSRTSSPPSISIAMIPIRPETHPPGPRPIPSLPPFPHQATTSQHPPLPSMHTRQTHLNTHVVLRRRLTHYSYSYPFPTQSSSSSSSSSSPATRPGPTQPSARKEAHA
jgi:hypothetical protein